MAFFDDVLDVLKSDERFFTDDGDLLRNAVYEAAMQMDSKLIHALYENEETRKRFFTDVDGVAVFDKVGFGWVIDNRQFLPDSYTRYKNKIGLADSHGDLISTTGDVELVFPYKDCVLEGGQTEEDQKRDEVFYNETLAPDEIDRLLYPKVLTDSKRYTPDTVEQEGIDFCDEDNLIIKGNNLLCASSLLHRYEGRIKLAYLDPPYNTDGPTNTFSYNNNFNHSSWLVFMKNRIELAKKLLSKDGSVCIAIDDYEYAPLKVLCDEIFGRQNYIGTIVVQSNPRGRTINSQFATCHEYALYYAKDINMVTISNQELTEEQRNQFKEKDEKGFYRWLPFRRSGGTSTPEERPNSEYPLFYSPSKRNIVAVGAESKGKRATQGKKVLFLDAQGAIEEEDEAAFLDANPEVERLMPIDILGKPRVWRWSDRKKVLQAAKDGDFAVDIEDGKCSVKLKDRVKEGRKPKTIWFDSRYDASANGTILLKKLFDGEKPFSYPKSIFTVLDTVRMLTDPYAGDIVLDFFAGSGTTAQAVYEANAEDEGNRQFILCEQMDYIETVTLERTRKVMPDDESFVYCELAKLNQHFVDAIESAGTGEELSELLDQILKSGFISYKVNPRDVDTRASDFDALSLADKKRLLMELLDKNQLYINLCDIDDATFKVSEADKAFTKSFYGEA